MPTGFTYVINEKGFNFKEWLEKNVSRAFIMSLRDDTRDINPQEILKRVKASHDHDIDYHQKNILEEELKLEHLYKKDDKQLKTMYEKKMEEFSKENRKDKKQDFEKESKYREVIKKANLLKEKTPNSKYENNKMILNAMGFVIEQCESSIEYDCGYGENQKAPYEYPEDMKRKMIESYVQSIKYHTEQLQESKEKKESNMKTIEEYFAFIEENKDVC